MKHTLKITILLIAIFFFAHVIGLAVINQYIDHKITQESGNVTWANLPYNIERPEIEQNTSYLWIMFAILIGTGLLLLLIRFQRVHVWKFWFFISVWLALSIAFGAFLKQYQLLAVIIAFLLGVWKVFRPNIWVHNATELFIYGGLAAIFVPIISVLGAFILLLIISVYDMIAVWKSKHMVKLAKFQTKSKVFAGLLIPYKIPKIPKKKKTKTVKIKTAVLGGGDIGFTLLFSGVVLKQLMLTNSVAIGFLKAMIVSVTTTVALFWLLSAAKKDKFYPAMPYLSIGCVVGYIILALIGF